MSYNQDKLASLKVLRDYLMRLKREDAKIIRSNVGVIVSWLKSDRAAFDVKVVVEESDRRYGNKIVKILISNGDFSATFSGEQDTNHTYALDAVNSIPFAVIVGDVLRDEPTREERDKAMMSLAGLVKV